MPDNENTDTGKIGKFVHRTLKYLDLAAELGLLVGLYRKTADGAKVLDKKELRKYAPKFARGRIEEALWTRLVDELDDMEKTAILQDFMCDDCLHEQQQADVMLSAIETAWGYGYDDNGEIKVGGDKAKAINTLKRIARLPDNEERIREVDSLQWIKNPPSEYWIVRLQNAAGRTFETVEELSEFLTPYFEQWAANSRARTAEVRQYRQQHANPPRPYHYWAPRVQAQGMTTFQRSLFEWTGLTPARTHILLRGSYYGLLFFFAGVGVYFLLTFNWHGLYNYLHH